MVNLADLVIMTGGRLGSKSDLDLLCRKRILGLDLQIHHVYELTFLLPDLSLNQLLPLLFVPSLFAFLHVQSTPDHLTSILLHIFWVNF